MTMLSLKTFNRTETQRAYQSRTKIYKIEFAQLAKNFLFLRVEKFHKHICASQSGFTVCAGQGPHWQHFAEVNTILLRPIKDEVHTLFNERHSD